MSRSRKQASLKNPNDQNAEECREERLMSFDNPFQFIENQFKKAKREFEEERNRLTSSLFPDTGSFFSSPFNNSSKILNKRNVDKLFSNFDEEPTNTFPGTCVSQSYVSSSKSENNGPMKSENYKSQTISLVDKKGKRISERKQAYKNSEGIDKISHERTLGEKGHKLVQAKNSGNQRTYEHNYYKGMNQDELEEFNKEYNEHKGKVNFEKSHKLLQGLPSKGNLLGNKKSKALMPDESSSASSKRKK